MKALRLLFCLFTMLYTLPALTKPAPQMMAYGQFSKLNDVKKITYVKELRRAVYELEKNSPFELALGDRPSSIFALFPQAYAAQGVCLVGGVQRSLVLSGSRTVCPTGGRGCGSFGDGGFQCGVIYNSACISRTPVGTLSTRCMSSAGDKVPTKADYEAKRQAVDRIVNDCQSGQIDSRYKERCTQFEGRVQSIAKQYKPEAVEPPKPAPKPPESAQPKPPLVEPEKPVEVKPPPPAAPPPPLAPKPPPVSPPPAATDEASAADCKGVYGMVIEGTGSGSTGYPEQGFHDASAKWADAYSKFADYTSIVPPVGPMDKIVRMDSQLVDRLQKAVGNVSEDKLCESAGPEFSKYMLGTGALPEAVGSAELLNYRLGGRPVADGQKVKVERQDMTDEGALEKTELMRKIQSMKSKCKKTDQVVMLTIKDHGSEDCRLSMGNGKYMNPQQMSKNLIEPLTKAGVKLVINFDSCYSGCFVDQLKKQGYGSNVCMTSTTRKSSVGYGTDGVVQGTYDDTYPKYLAKLKNPLKAHICASLWDPLNEPKVASSQPSFRSITPPRQQSLRDVGEALGYSNLESDCARVNNSYSPVPGVSEAKMKSLFACPDVRNTLKGALGEKETANFLDSVVDPSRAPGVEALRELAADKASIGGIKSACDIDLSQYAKKLPAPQAIPASDEGVIR